MSDSPQELHKFYKDQSDFIHPVIGEDETTAEINVRGIAAIRERVGKLNLRGMKISLEGGGLDAQPSDNECVLIICNGFVTTEPNAAPLAFVQTFVLAPQQAAGETTKKSFFVRNSVFRLINGGNVARTGSSPTTPPVVVAAVAEPVVSPKPAPVVVKDVPQSVPEATLAAVAALPAARVTESVMKPSAPSTATPATNAAKASSQPAPESAEVPKEVAQTSSSSVSSSEAALAVAAAPDEPVEKKPFSYASAVTIRGGAPAANVAVAQKVSTSGGPGWSVAPTRQQKTAEKSSEKSKEEVSSKENKEVSVSKSTSSSDAAPQAGKKELGPSLYLNKLNPETTKEDILKMFSAYGKVGKIDLNTRGFAFVEYDNRQSVLDALAAHKENEAKHKLRGKLIEIQEKQGNKEKEKGNGGGKSKGKEGQQANGKKKEKSAPVEAS